MTDLRYILVAGFGWSGSSAVVDLLKEIGDYYEPDIEFRAIKDPYGLDDLYHNLVENWDMLNSDMAIRDFLWLMNHLYQENGRKLSLKRGLNYQLYYGPHFIDQVNSYISKLVDFSYQSAWWYLDFKKSQETILKERIKYKITGRDGTEDTRMYFSKPTEEKFCRLTQDFIDNIFRPIANDHKASNIILDQGICIQKYKNESKFFRNQRTIVVDRDPRDIYADLCLSGGLIGKELASSHDVEKYIAWHLAVRDRVHSITDHNPDILSVRFEDLVLNYEETVSMIFQFLGGVDSKTIKSRKFFDPAISANNIGLWKNRLNQREMDLIEDKLEEYIYT